MLLKLLLLTSIVWFNDDCGCYYEDKDVAKYQNSIRAEFDTSQIQKEIKAIHKPFQLDADSIIECNRASYDAQRVVVDSLLNSFLVNLYYKELANVNEFHDDLYTHKVFYLGDVRVNEHSDLMLFQIGENKVTEESSITNIIVGLVANGTFNEFSIVELANKSTYFVGGANKKSHFLNDESIQILSIIGASCIHRPVDEMTAKEYRRWAKMERKKHRCARIKFDTEGIINVVKVQNKKRRAKQGLTI